MRGDIVYRIYGLHEGRDTASFFGAFRTRAEAEAEIERLLSREMNGKNWAAQYHNKGFEIRPAQVDTDFEIPPKPTPREAYEARASSTSAPGTWETVHVEVLRHASPKDEGIRICDYDRSYAMLRTFEPFRQRGRDFALVSPDYEKTSVLDLATGRIIAEEPDGPDLFCPVGFYVPDWWDVHAGSIIPGSEYWSADKEWPNGDFGFVWGCHWGDDSSWKVQHLDLSRIQEGIISRDDRFGYVELATIPTSDPGRPPPFIRVFRQGGADRVTFAVEMTFDLASGKPDEWQRLKRQKKV